MQEAWQRLNHIHTYLLLPMMIMGGDHPSIFNFGKSSFISDWGIYCYTAMPFELQNMLVSIDGKLIKSASAKDCPKYIREIM